MHSSASSFSPALQDRNWSTEVLVMEKSSVVEDVDRAESSRVDGRAMVMARVMFPSGKHFNKRLLYANTPSLALAAVPVTKDPTFGEQCSLSIEREAIASLLDTVSCPYLSYSLNVGADRKRKRKK